MPSGLTRARERLFASHAGGCASGASVLYLSEDGPGFLIIVLDRIKFCEDLDKLADPPARQRLACVHERFVVDDPGLGLRPFVYLDIRGKRLPEPLNFL